jgi:hypothetical protein
VKSDMLVIPFPAPTNLKDILTVLKYAIPEPDASASGSVVHRAQLPVFLFNVISLVRAREEIN